MNGFLVGEAKKAEDVAAALQIWLDRLPTCATDISAIMSDLFAIGSTLRTIDEAMASRACQALYHNVEGELHLLLDSLGRTLTAVNQMLGWSSLNGSLSSYICAVSWEALCVGFRNEGPSLRARLDLFRTYMGCLLDMLHGCMPNLDLDFMYSRLEYLVGKQEEIPFIFEDYLADVGALTEQAPIHGHVPGPSYAAPPPQSPFSDEWEMQNPPSVPSVPQSPTISITSTQTYSSGQTFSSNSSLTTSAARHWACRVFNGRHSSTPLHGRTTPTRCCGREDPAAEQRLEMDGFFRVLQLPFEATEVVIRLYWRPTDSRARILYSATDRQSGRPKMYSVPLTTLLVRRSGACLLLGSLDGKHFDLWANLRFTIYERMVLFYCAFAALKAQDAIKPAEPADDFTKIGEAHLYGGVIEDGRSKFAIRIYRDEDSAGLRIETSALRGQMTKIPIWTAFIAQSVRSRSWVQKISSRVVRLSELQPYVFCDHYAPPRDARGRYELRFSSRSDADGFVEELQDLRALYPR